MSRLEVASSRIRIGASRRNARAIEMPLPLAARELLPAVADDRVEAVGQRLDELERVRLRAASRISSRVADSLPQRMFSSIVSLKRNTSWLTTAIMLAQVLERELADVLAVDQDAAPGDVEDPRKQAHERALAGAARADEREDLPFATREAHVLEDRRARARPDRRRTRRRSGSLARRLVIGTGCRGLVEARLPVEDLEDALAGARRPG